MARNRTQFILLLAFSAANLLILGVNGQKECIADAPVTFEDADILEHIKSCIAAPEKYSITAR